MKRGRKPKPSVVKKLEGNRGRRPLNKREPKPSAPLTLSPPDWLQPVALEYWRRLAPRLQKIGLLTELDIDLLAMLCDAWQRKHDARKTIEEVGAYHFTESGFVVAHPALAQEHKATEQIRKLNSDLGLTPSARTGLTTGNTKPAGKLGKYVTHGNAAS